MRPQAYAYGDAIIQDIGYYPYGSHFFSGLTHYVRSGDFVQALLRDSRDPDGYAFALGALAHYAGPKCLLPSYVNQEEKDEVGRDGFGFRVNIDVWHLPCVT